VDRLLLQLFAVTVSAALLWRTGEGLLKKGSLWLTGNSRHSLCSLLCIAAAGCWVQGLVLVHVGPPCHAGLSPAASRLWGMWSYRPGTCWAKHLQQQAERCSLTASRNSTHEVSVSLSLLPAAACKAGTQGALWLHQQALRSGGEEEEQEEEAAIGWRRVITRPMHPCGCLSPCDQQSHV